MNYIAINKKGEFMWAYTLEALKWSVGNSGGSLQWTIYKLVPVKAEDRE